MPEWLRRKPRPEFSPLMTAARWIFVLLTIVAGLSSTSLHAKAKQTKAKQARPIRPLIGVGIDGHLHNFVSGRITVGARFSQDNRIEGVGGGTAFNPLVLFALGMGSAFPPQLQYYYGLQFRTAIWEDYFLSLGFMRYQNDHIASNIEDEDDELNGKLRYEDNGLELGFGRKIMGVDVAAHLFIKVFHKVQRDYSEYTDPQSISEIEKWYAKRSREKVIFSRIPAISFTRSF